jgi:hypothetical protein
MQGGVSLIVCWSLVAGCWLSVCCLINDIITIDNDCQLIVDCFTL